MKKIRVVLTGGGSGGHTIPLLAVAEELQKIATEKKLELHVNYLGPYDAFTELVRASGIKTSRIAAAKLRSYSIFQNILDIPKFFVGIIQAFWSLFWIMPNVIFSKGGPGAFPVVLAGWFYRIPILIHDSDAIPGVTNILSSRFANRVALGFDRAKNYFDEKKTAVTGNPIRPWMIVDVPDQRNAKQSLGFKPELPLTLILGGSQGSRRINEFIVTHLALITEETQILHQTGAGNVAEIETLSKAALGEASYQSTYRLVPYLDKDLKSALAAADCIVMRAGASSINEAAAFGKPAILIPLPESAHDHQRANALAFERAGGAVILEEENLFIGIFLSALKKILQDHDHYEKMAQSARSFFKQGAAETLAREVFLLAGIL
ncbi:MAG: UDP-N-acetylglucosamine--N-acetylmuramyl-(pentapeptide) pyrophosphoryl-undecaprenol N-acetylglucosamine transferase [Patescibacteria group bacterium]|nr:UDP-N-acetylglucosamine--N-acetylmuramyl-(pentapeptide) pyrophosphoryl-undecaprenol N-acetylglucosamine transferase [Patescibacteria group bacterium]